MRDREEVGGGGGEGAFSVCLRSHTCADLSVKDRFTSCRYGVDTFADMRRTVSQVVGLESILVFISIESTLRQTSERPFISCQYGVNTCADLRKTVSQTVWSQHLCRLISACQYA